VPLSKDPEKRAKSLANLIRTGRAVYKPKKLKIKISREGLIRELSGTDIIEFATKYLEISFRERPAQEVVLRSLYGLPLNEEQLGIYQKITKNKTEFEAGEEKNEAVLALGARSGKSFLASIIALYEAICRGNYFREYLNKGEFGYVVIVATRQKQAEQVIGANCARILSDSKLSYLIKGVYSTELILKNNLKIISLPCNSTSGRGIPIFTFILDEIAFYQLEGVRSDEIIFNALRPRLAQFPRAKTILISNAGAKQGLFWQFLDEGFSVPNRLTCQASTRIINPVIPQDFIDSEYRRDPENSSREFGAIFAEKVEAFFSLELIKNALKFAGDLKADFKNNYKAGIDQSGLSGRDRFSFAVSHREGENIFVDCIRSWNTKDIKVILKDIKELRDRYNLRGVLIDLYAKGYVMQALKDINLIAEIRPSLAEIFTNLKSLALMDRLFLPASRELEQSLRNTIAYYGRSNKLTIAHERSVVFGHGDIADALSSAVYASSLEKAVRRQGRIYTRKKGFSSITQETGQLINQFKGKVFFGGEKKTKDQEREKEKLKLKILSKHKGNVYYREM